MHFRYAWGRNPLAKVQLTGHSDVPLATQRSDRWDVLEVPIRAEGGDDGQKLGKVREALREDDRKRRVHEARTILATE